MLGFRVLFPRRQQRHRVGRGGAEHARLARGIADGRFQLADRLVVANVDDLHFRRDRVADADGFREAPARFEKDRSGAGKIFRDDGTMINRLFGAAKAIPADVYVGESLIDGQPSLILDYSHSKLWPDVRDEIREVAPGLYLGVMYKGNPATQKMYFTLEARK